LGRTKAALAGGNRGGESKIAEHWECGGERGKIAY